VADGSPSADERGTSTAPLRNVMPDDTVDAGPVRAPKVDKPALDKDFAKNFEALKAAYVAQVPQQYRVPENLSAARVAAAEAVGQKAAADAAKGLADLTPQKVIDAATALANAWIDTTLTRIKNAGFIATTCAKAAYKEHFAAESVDEIKTVNQKIADLLNGLRTDSGGLNSSSVTYECGGSCFGNPAETGNFNRSMTTLCDSLWPDVFEDYLKTPPNYEKLALVLIHEGLHRTAWFNFKHPFGETYVATTEYRKLGLSGHLAEADSFAYFAKAIAACDG